MSSGSDPLDHRVDPRRSESTALVGLGVQALAAVLALAVALVSQSQALRFLAMQAAVGIAFWTLGWLRLRLIRGADEETRDLQAAEERRRQQGVQALFEEQEQGRAQRNLNQFDRYFAPLAALLLAAVLLVPVVWSGVWLATGGWESGLAKLPAIPENRILVAAAFSIGISLGMFLMGTYAAGLGREARLSGLRAGAGYMLGSALFFFGTALALALTSRGWLQNWPDRILAALVLLWMALQAIEMLLNLVFDFYRPRLAGVEARPAFDSRISGLLAEPQGIFRTFAHTMDYQFGFRVSDTWFFRFLEQAFAPLVLMQLLTFYLLTCFVIVQPGEVAIVERWGAPRGVSALPADDAAWDQLAEPKGPGLHIKWPWPVETARIVPHTLLQVQHVGFEIADREQADAKALELHNKTVSWDAEHVSDEYEYIMPMPETMRDAVATRESAEGERRPDNALFLSGMFSIEYRIGRRPGDVYRFVYKHRNSEEILRSLFERELTAYMAGARFWDLMVDRPSAAREAVQRGMQKAADEQQLGIEVVAVQIQNVHPPAGEVGKAYQEVLMNRQKAQESIYAGEIQARRTLGLVESQKNAVLSEAKAYSYHRRTVAEAEAERFRSQLQAREAAPGVYETRLRMQAIEEGLEQSAPIIHPPGIEVRLDTSKLPSLEEMEIQRGVLKAAEGENR